MSDPLTVTVNALAPLVAEGIRALIQSADGRAALDTQLARMRAADPGSPIGPRIDAAIATAMARVDTSPAAGVPAHLLRLMGPPRAPAIPPAPAVNDLAGVVRRALDGQLSDVDRVLLSLHAEHLEAAGGT